MLMSTEVSTGNISEKLNGTDETDRTYGTDVSPPSHRSHSAFGYRSLDDLQLITAGIAHVESQRPRNRSRVGDNLDTGITKSVLSRLQISNLETNMPRAQRPALFVFY